MMSRPSLCLAYGDSTKLLSSATAAKMINLWTRHKQPPDTRLSAPGRPHQGPSAFQPLAQCFCSKKSSVSSMCRSPGSPLS